MKSMDPDKVVVKERHFEYNDLPGPATMKGWLQVQVVWNTSLPLTIAAIDQLTDQTIHQLIVG